MDSSGAAYADFVNVAYTGSSSDGGSTGIERAAEGHLEVFVMGSQSDSNAQSGGSDNPTYPSAYWADHAHLDCSIVDAGFKINSGASQLGQSAVLPSEDCNSASCPAAGDREDALSGAPLARYDFDYDRPYSPLKGNVSFINTARGVGAGTTALHIEGFGNNYNLVTAQEYPYFLEPTLASNTGLWASSFVEFDAAGLFNEWSVNSKTGASTDWIVAFPDKYLHVDIADDLQAGVNLARLGDELGYKDCETVFGGYQCDGGEVEPTLLGAVQSSGNLDQVLGPFSEAFDGQSCDEVTFDLYDREENSVRGGGTSISPAPPVPASSLCYEINVITFGGADSVLDSRLAQTVDVSGLTSGASAGWMDLSFSNSSEGGLPVAGFALKERDFGDPNKNYGQLMDHGYDRDNSGS